MAPDTGTERATPAGGPDGPGRLLVVATPIGNLEDLSPRAAATLRDADLVLAEDTRRTGRLLAHVGSEAPQRSYHEHNARERIPEVLARLRAGASVALVTDAGTPAISDPGFRLVRACAEAGVAVIPIPGPSAALAAVAASGLPTDRFVVEGFLPRSGSARRERLEDIAAEQRTVVLFVSPHRAVADLADLAEAVGEDRPGALARELTKLHEEIRRDSLGALRDTVAAGVRGELTLVLAGAPAPDGSELADAELVSRVRALVSTGVGRKQAIKDVAAATNLPKRRVYQAVVDAGS